YGLQTLGNRLDVNIETFRQLSQTGANFGQSIVELRTAAASAALHMGAIGGVYLVGGILPKILSSMQDSDFADRFCQRGRFRQYMEEMPVILSTDNDLGLKGAALALKNQY
ncbi:MAG: glucokinase, partial [Pseudomonadales bacterium]